MDFKTLFEKYHCKAIRGCPGRFIIKEKVSLEQLLQNEHKINLFHPASVPDPVLIAIIEQGAIISYQKKDGTQLHTLNTWPGFLRKIAKLGIQRENID